jgi:group I intron endonuclease
MKKFLDYPKKAGIYKFTCIKNGKIYIGKSINIYFRLSCHKSCVKKPKGRYYFEHALIKHGWDGFEIDILEIIDNFDKSKDNKRLLDIETGYIKLFESTNPEKGYNILKNSTDSTGSIRSDEFRKNISLRQLGRKLSDETKEKIRQSRLGQPGTPHSKEHKEKMRVLNLGKKMSLDSKEKLRNIKLGTTLSEETKFKMSQSKIGNSNALGFKHSEKTKQKLKDAKLRNKLANELDALIDVGLTNVAGKNIEVNY